ncbi:MAG: hypothetical protein QXL22_03150 [Candidatus Nezhaarchaeales archaeon]
MSKLNYKLILYALLHDVGKPVVRFIQRYFDKVEEGDISEEAKKYLENFLNNVIENMRSKRHEELSEDIVKKILGTAPSESEKESIDTIIAEVDGFAASERGISVERELYKKVEKLWNIVEDEVTKRFGITHKYSHHVVPMLSPLWVLTRTNYLDYVGISANLRGVVGKWPIDDARKSFAELFAGYGYVTLSRDSEFVESVSKVIGSLVNEELWFPVKPLNIWTSLELKALKLNEAIKQSSYAEVIKYLINGLSNVRKLYGGSVGRGAIDSILDVLKSSSALVPSAIYWSLLPDISLYSHSKLVAAYTACRQLSSKVRWLVIDANNIQKFISSPIVAAAASRVIRGRSLLVELSLDSLANYALELFGSLTRANVVISEGGTLDLVVPDLHDINARMAKLKGIAKELSRFLGGGLGFTIAVSDTFEIKNTRFHDTVTAIIEGKKAGDGGFWRVLEDVRYRLAVEKSRKGVDEEDLKSEGVVAREEDVIGFDAITGEPVVSYSAGISIASSYYALRVNSEIKGYVDEIAGPNKIAIGSILGTATHLSLVAGTAARGLLYIVGIHVYRKDQNGVPTPAEDVVLELVQKLCESLHGSSNRLYSSSIGTDVGIVPLEPSGSIYILISAPRGEGGTIPLFDPQELMPIAIGYLLNVIDNLKKVLFEYTNNKNGLDIYVDVEFVNIPYTSTPMNEYLIISLKELIGKGIDVAIGTRFLGSYHPVWWVKETQEDVGKFVLADLDPYEIIAVAKMDIDMFGKVRELLACSPSRLVTLSDLVNAVVSGKVYAYAIAMQRSLAKLQKVLDVIPLYAGGDDVTIYGKWAQVVRYIVDVVKSVRDALKPLTVSIGIAIDRSTAPILMLYSRAVETLEKAKKVRASASIDIVEHLGIFRCDGDTYKALDVIPLECASKFYPMSSDSVISYNLEVMAKIFDVLPSMESGVLNKLTEFEEFKRELHILAEVGSEVLKTIDRSPKDACRPLKDLILYPDKMLSLEIMYSYTWARRSSELSKLKDVLKKYGLDLLKYPDDIVNKTSTLEALRVLLSLKPIIDLIMLALRRKEAVEPSNFIQVRI